VAAAEIAAATVAAVVVDRLPITSQ
jgi:hypothetical protein